MGIVVQNKQMLISALQQHGAAIKAFGVFKLGLFGSFANDTTHPGSDVDFLVEFMPGQKNYDNFMDLSFYLEDLLGRRVELVTEQALSKYIGPYILNQAEDVAIG